MSSVSSISEIWLIVILVSVILVSFIFGIVFAVRLFRHSRTIAPRGDLEMNGVRMIKWQKLRPLEIVAEGSSAIVVKAELLRKTLKIVVAVKILKIFNPVMMRNEYTLATR